MSESPAPLFKKSIVFFGRPQTLACDGRCDKAWGINGRPTIQLSPDDVDDYVYVSDDVLGTAPGPGETKGYSEGGHLKPCAARPSSGDDLNKWCARECERSVMVRIGEAIHLPDFSHPSPNIPTPINRRRS